MTTLDASYALCRELNKRHGTTYYWSTFLLPRVKRHHVHALYGFCRHADDIVDDLGPAPVDVREEALTDFGDRFFADLEAGDSDDAVLKAVVHTVRRYDIDGIHMDDYFYPYPDDKKTPFPDNESYASYRASKGFGPERFFRGFGGRLTGGNGRRGVEVDT